VNGSRGNPMAANVSKIEESGANSVTAWTPPEHLVRVEHQRPTRRAPEEVV
jgi:hypothetical protein